MQPVKNRIEWLSALQGFSMLLVVLGHVTLSNEFQDPAHPVAAALERIIYTFHMPLFIFISGWLFCLTCLDKEISYKDAMRKKFLRLGVPFLAFTVVTIVIKLGLSHFVKRPVDAQELIDTFILFRSNPLGEMWFIIVLLILMLCFPVYKWLIKNNALIWGLCGSLLLFIVVPEDISYFNLSKAVRLLVYFIMGIICCHYKIVEKYASRWYTIIMSLALFICVNCLELTSEIIPAHANYVIGCMAGIALSTSLCCYLVKIRRSAFDSFSRYTFQIFLVGIFFQIAVRILYGRIGHTGSFIYPMLFLVSVIAGIYVPVAIARLIESRFPRIKKFIGL